MYPVGFVVATAPRNFCAIAPATLSFPSAAPQRKLSTTNERVSASTAASIVMFCIVPGVTFAHESGLLQSERVTGWYDDRLKYRSPPFFLDPVQAAWKINRSNEQVPAAG